MKNVGLILLFIGFAAISWQAVNISMYTYIWDNWHIQNNIQDKEQIDRKVAISIMSDLKLRYDKKYRKIIYPALIMLVGGVVIYSQARKKQEEPT